MVMEGKGSLQIHFKISDHKNNVMLAIVLLAVVVLAN